MILALAFALAAGLQFALQSAALPVFLAACRPLLLVVVAASRTRAPLRVAWLGLAAGLAGDLLNDRIIGPGGIAVAVAGWVVATIVDRFELKGPLFWLTGAAVATAASEAIWLTLLTSLGAPPDHGWSGALAAVAVTVLAAVLVAMAEVAWQTWRSPERKRRRAIRRR